jgi:Secretion system C-terminal sorting domain
MKKTNTLFALFMFLTFHSFAQPFTEIIYTWTGMGSDNKWTTKDNWSRIPDDPADVTGYPRNYSPSKAIIAYAKINISANIIMDIPNLSALNSLSIGSGANVNIYGDPNLSLVEFYIQQANNSSMATGLTIASGAYLTIGAKTSFLINSSNCPVTVEGTIEVAGGANSNATRAQFGNQSTGITSVTTVASGGKLKVSGSSASFQTYGTNTLKFESGSTLEIQKNTGEGGGQVPSGQFKSGSTIKITGTTNSIFTTASPSFEGCNLEFNRPNCTVASSGGSNNTSISASSGIMPMFNDLKVIAGDLSILGSFVTSGNVSSGNVNSITVIGGSLNFEPTSAVNNFTVKNNITVTGGNLKMAFRPNAFIHTFNVQGDVNQTAGTIDLSNSNGNTVLSVLGNVTQSGGIITETGTSSNSKLVFSGSNTQAALFKPGGLTGDALNLEINKTSNNVTLASGVTVPKDLILTSGNVILGSNNIIVNGLATGGKATSHVVTDAAGNLTIKAVDAVGKDFPVGISTASYDPVNIKNTTGANDFKVSVGSTITGGVPSSYISIIPRQWEIESPLSAGATLAFTPGMGLASSAKIGHYIGGAWDLTTSSTTNAPSYTGTFTSFSPFIIASQVLPVELVSFKAKKTGNVNELNWQTASEKNNSHFDIERSANGQSEWVKLGEVKGNGNSIVTQNYAFTDKGPLSISYYRLKQIDQNGDFEYSNVVSVVDKKGKFNIASIAPNPTKETSTIIYNSDKNETINLTLMDVSGRIVLAQNVSITEGPNNLSLNLSNLTNGLYILNLKNSEQVLIQKIVKQ